MNEELKHGNEFQFPNTGNTRCDGVAVWPCYTHKCLRSGMCTNTPVSLKPFKKKKGGSRHQKKRVRDKRLTMLFLTKEGGNDWHICGLRDVWG